MTVKKLSYQSPAIEEMDLFVDAPIAASYDEFGDQISDSDTEYDW